MTIPPPGSRCHLCGEGMGVLVDFNGGKGVVWCDDFDARCMVPLAGFCPLCDLGDFMTDEITKIEDYGNEGDTR